MTLPWLEDIEGVFDDDEEEPIVKKKTDNEVYLALIGKVYRGYWYGIGHWPTEGRPARVDFDGELVDKRWNDIVGFFHTHPNMTSSPSGVDYRAMAGWTVSFGKPLVCCIEGVDGLKAHWFIDDEHRHVTGPVRRFGKMFIGKVPNLKPKEIAKK